MKIDAITTCVGKAYCDMLIANERLWSNGTATLTIATTPEWAFYLAFRMSGVHIVATDAFTRDGAYFNKGRALNEAYAARDPQDWVLLFDADITPPRYWDELIEPHLRARCLHSCRRDDGEKFWPGGYFQLFHSQDPAVTNRSLFHSKQRAASGPLFSDHYPHAGCYDADFMERWPTWRRVELPIRVSHTGPRRTNWFGEGNEDMTRELILYGVKKYRREHGKTR